MTPAERNAAASCAANWEPSTAAINLDDTPLQSLSIFYRNSNMGLRDVTDVLSSILLLAERINGGFTAGGHAVSETHGALQFARSQTRQMTTAT